MASKLDSHGALPPQFEDLDTLLIAVRKEHREATKKDVVLAMLDMLAEQGQPSGIVRTLQKIAERPRSSE